MFSASNASAMARKTVASHTGSSWFNPSIEKGVVEMFSGSCRSGAMKGDTIETPNADALEHL